METILACLTWLSDHQGAIFLCALPIAIPLILFQVLPLLVLMERRGASFIQDRIGPNRAGVNLSAKALGALALRKDAIAGVFAHERDPQATGLRLRAFGMLFNMADLVKILFKEHFIAPFAEGFFYKWAPVIPVGIALFSTALIPWFAPFSYVVSTGGFGHVVGQAIDAHSGLLALFAVGSLGVYGIVLGSWASNSKYALLGGMRSSAMMISYEVSMGLSVLGLLLIYGSFSLTEGVLWQESHTWGAVVQPVGFVLFLIAMFAEANRNPFDVAEGESEIVAGFHTEFNGIRFMLIMTAEYFHVMLASVLLAVLFLGGWSILPVPGFGSEWVRDNLGLVLGIGLIAGGVLKLGFAWLIAGRRRHYARINASDKAQRLREYGFYTALLSGAGLAFIAGGIASILLLDPEPITIIAPTGEKIFATWVNLLTAVVQFKIILVKALMFCWLFVWVRWTLPRFRYDQIMGLGWKVLLNIALVNLLVTALIAKLVRG